MKLVRFGRNIINFDQVTHIRDDGRRMVLFFNAPFQFDVQFELGPARVILDEPDREALRFWLEDHSENGPAPFELVPDEQMLEDAQGIDKDAAAAWLATHSDLAALDNDADPVPYGLCNEPVNNTICGTVFPLEFDEHGISHCPLCNSTAIIHFERAPDDRDLAPYRCASLNT